MRTVAAVFGACATASLASILATLWFVQPPKKDVKRKNSSEWPQEIVDEQQARSRAFLRDEGMDKLRRSTVVIVGAGGVGSWVATMLVRTGVGKVRIIDFDQVTLSSLNRHATATLADVGTPKVNCVAKFLTAVAPWVTIEPIISLWTKDHAHLLDGADYVVDCIDNIETKVDLLAHCYHNKIPVIASMGAGCKGDPTRVDIRDISQTIEDPLSRVTRVKLRFKGISTGIPVVFSSEKPGPDKAKLLDIADKELEKGEVGELSVLQDFRVRILPVLGPMPALFGLTIATHLLTWLGGYHSVYDPVQGGYPLVPKNRHKLHDSLFHSLIGQFARLKTPEARKTTLSVEDAAYILDEVWRGKTITGQCNHIRLTLWDPAGPRDVTNIIPMNSEQATRHEQLVLKEGKALSDVWPQEVLETVAKRQELNQWYLNFR